MIDEMCGDGHQCEVALDQLDRPVLLLGDVLKVVLVVDQAARKAHPTSRCASRASGSTLIRRPQRELVGPWFGAEDESRT